MVPWLRLAHWISRGLIEETRSESFENTEGLVTEDLYVNGAVGWMNSN